MVGTFRGMVFAVVGLVALGLSPASASERPNIMIVLADDLGFSDLGCYGGEIETPNLNRLAENGIRFTQFYNTGRCWPTRASLLTGFYPQQVRRDKVPGVPSGARGQRPEWAPLISNLLQQAGYRTYHSGKWHLDGMPLQTGFDRSYYLRDQGRFFNPKVHYKDDIKLPPIEKGTEFYGTTAIADHAIEFLKDHADNHSDQPFFHYLAFTAPHFPLHGKAEDVEKYLDRYNDGWEVARKARWDRIQEMGLLDAELSEVEANVGPPYHFPEALEKLGPGEVNRPLPWTGLTDEQQIFQATKMAIHAAMVDRMDRELGRVLSQIDEMGALDNTLILFLSDNGASAEIMVRDDGHDPTARPGSAASYLCLGPGWSTVGNTPFRRHKTWNHEGGIATPMIVHWPARLGKDQHGKFRRQPAHVIDVVPTLIEVAGLESEQFESSQVRPGTSLLETLVKDSKAPSTYWWSHEANRALRVGDWKIVAAGKDEPWELFDMSADRTETKNLALQQTKRVQEMVAEWQELQTQFFAQAKQGLTEAKANTKTNQDAKNEAQDEIKSLILAGEAFRVDGRPAFIFTPDGGLKQNQPWVLYAPTLPGLPDQHEKWMHQQFLAAGIAVAGVDVGEGYGSPNANKVIDQLYDVLVERGFAKKPVLLGRSRGGLWMTSWAIQHPDRVAALAGIYPVFDLRSYPGLAKAAPAYQMTEAELTTTLDSMNPIANVEKLASAKIPVFLIHGDQDRIVPIEANSQAFKGVYLDQGSKDLIELEVASGQGHNFWEGFFRCEALIEFVVKNSKAK